MTDETSVRRIHAAGLRFVLAITGGGASAIGELLRVPGGSRSVLECVVPYSAVALREWIGGCPDQYCSEPTARAMAMAAFERARQLVANEPDADPYKLIGIGCTASLTSDQPKRGPHRVFVASQSAGRTATSALELTRGARTRQGEEAVCAALILAVAADAAEQVCSHRL
jgi:nicotinamide mononucleotide (NMN) deamidase PncC